MVSRPEDQRRVSARAVTLIEMYMGRRIRDRFPGDGIYTNDTIRTNPTCNFYERFTLPKDVGVRIVARDENNNYVMADTSLTVVNGIDLPWVPLLLLN